MFRAHVLIVRMSKTYYTASVISGYYIGRIFRHQRAIKEEIYIGKNVEEKCVFLSSTEQEFEQIVKLNPNSNVHWLEKNKL